MLRIIQKKLSTMGIQVAKWPAAPFVSPSVFDMCLNQKWVFEKGEAFRFIQVGANDGISGGDPLRKHILGRGWTGILIEPQPDVFLKLKANYADQSRLHFENVGVSHVERQMTLYRNQVENTTASLDQSVLNAHHDSSTTEEIEIQCVRLDSIIKKYELDNIDLLQVDTEGHELEVMQSIDLGSFRPRIIHFEHGHLSRERLNTLIMLLDSAGYEIHYGGKQYIDSLALLPE